MNIYVESNFVLELALMQEEYKSCENILSLCEAGEAHLIIPAYSLAEPHETLIRREKDRKQLAQTVERELTQLNRSLPYKAEVNLFQPIVNLLTQSGAEERQRLSLVRNRFFQMAALIPLNKDVLSSASRYEQEGFSPQDAIVYASVIQHLEEFHPLQSCFLNRNAKDFADPDIRDTLAKYDCKLLFSFEDGHDFAQSKANQS